MSFASASLSLKGGQKSLRHKALPALAAGLFAAGFLPLLAPGSAAALGVNVYAAATGGSGTACTVGAPCTLFQALLNANAGDTILLTTPGSTAHYVGNWTVSTSGTTPSTPLTIQPAPGVTNPILDGNAGLSSGCTTSACSGAILSVAAGVSLTLNNLTIENANNTATGRGGGIDTGDGATGGTVVVSGATFSSNLAQFGAAINSGEVGAGTVTVTNSTFTSNQANQDGGAIDNGDFSGTSTLTVTNSTFSMNKAVKYSGGAIDSSDDSGNATATVTSSTFSGNSAGQSGGAIGSGDYGGSGTVTVTHSTFSGNTAGTGTAIDGGSNSGAGTVKVAANIFNGTCHQAAGTWNDGGYNVATDSSCFNSGTADSSALLASELGSLANNGGPTLTIEPLTGNPALALIPNPTTVTLGTSMVSICPTTDQRGVPSLPSPAKCNSGALQPDPTFTADSPPTSASLCSAYSYTFVATFGLPLTYTVASGALPSGLTLNSTSGVLSGLPNLTGTYTFTISASDPSFGPIPVATTPTLSITVTGSCTPGVPTLSGSTFLNPSALSFGSVKVGSMSAYQTFTLTNFNFSAPLVVSSLVLVAPFHISNTSTCPATLGPLQSCTVVVYFAPTSTGAIQAGLDIFDNASGSPQVVVASGTGF